MEILSGLIGALIGGAFTLFGARKTIDWQAQREARGAATAIAAELSVAQRMIVQEGGGEIYQRLLNDMKATGLVPDRRLLVDLLDNQPQDVLPVYYSMAGKLGLFPPDLASRVVEYHSIVIALPRIVVQMLGKRELDVPTVRSLAASVERQWHKVNEMRPDLISGLTAFSAGTKENKRKGLARLVSYSAVSALLLVTASCKQVEPVAAANDCLDLPVYPPAGVEDRKQTAYACVERHAAMYARGPDAPDAIAEAVMVKCEEEIIRYVEQAAHDAGKEPQYAAAREAWRRHSLPVIAEARARGCYS